MGRQKMKNIIFIVAGLLLLSSFVTIGFGNEAGENDFKTMSINFVEPTIVDNENFLKIDVKNTNTYNFNPGEPLLPVYTETISLPFGVTINNVEFTAENVQSMTLSKKIIPAPSEISLNTNVANSKVNEEDEQIYSSEDFYPNDWISYDVGVGLDEKMEHKTFLTIRAYPIRYSPGLDTIQYTDNIQIEYSYKITKSNPFPLNTEYQLVIIAPSKFESELGTLVAHKISKGVTTTLKTTEDIYSEFTGYDKPEQIKYFIKYALETWNTKYVLLVGGMDSILWANPRDNVNEGTKDWYIPVRYSNLRDNEPGYLCDLYYSDIYDSEGNFSSWDSNGDHIYAYWKGGLTKRDKLDMYPDVALGRLPCRNIDEVKNVVDKIINYENNADPSWFEKIITVSGDGFLDQEALNIQWNTNALPNGDYTIHAQSSNPVGDTGPTEVINVKIDKTKTTKITFNHNDNERISTYPGKPIAEIVSISEGDILGNTDYSYSPTEKEAYCNDISGWANINYKSGVLTINGKTYDPKPYGNTTDIHVWITNSASQQVFTKTISNSPMFFEGEWTVGDKLLNGRAGGSYYMPSNFERVHLWTSMGTFTGQKDVINAMSQGSGFVFFSGHGSPSVWADHKPGVPGNRKLGGVYGLKIMDTKLPIFPMNKITNTYKNPIVVVGGCHNAMFNVSIIPTFLDRTNKNGLQSYGYPIPECWCEWLVRLPKTGAIASIGNTGYGFGTLGEYCTIGGMDNWITTEFFNQYGTLGQDVLGVTHSQCIKSYIDTFGKKDSSDVQSIQQWVLLGDPSLKIGGY
jgi:hypothetical protein